MKLNKILDNYKVAVIFCVVCMLVAVCIGQARKPYYVGGVGVATDITRTADGIATAIEDIGSAGVGVIGGLIGAAFRICKAILKTYIKLVIWGMILSAVLSLIGLKAASSAISSFVRHPIRTVKNGINGKNGMNAGNANAKSAQSQTATKTKTMIFENGKVTAYTSSNRETENKNPHSSTINVSYPAVRKGNDQGANTENRN